MAPQRRPRRCICICRTWAFLIDHSTPNLELDFYLHPLKWSVPTRQSTTHASLRGLCCLQEFQDPNSNRASGQMSVRILSPLCSQTVTVDAHDISNAS